MEYIRHRSGLMVPGKKPEPPPAPEPDMMKPVGHGNRVIELLPMLKGRPFNMHIWGWLHAFRPSKIRIGRGGVTCDCCPWRITVWLNKDETIRRIEQEVQFGLFGEDANATTEYWERMQSEYKDVR